MTLKLIKTLEMNPETEEMFSSDAWLNLVEIKGARYVGNDIVEVYMKGSSQPFCVTTSDEWLTFFNANF